ncbi:patatin-like phospholipase family protein [Pontibacter cellulosilyticus]|uniref:Patatin-like phospholipase family protein n=1 Tax=Pontibacter cellulosilyticus TaxID=1720253 RepID=A0A923SI81_9BACT|nr:patatin-like phospholipase family protein [Pontibacter cellulosilyticus]MBC5991376.1 patatin-like phospholipase family protein [Pontibacter cellulosilyticus]
MPPKTHSPFTYLQLLALLVALYLGTPHVYAQKVALVFSGGGAKGIAHVGVLKALEEHNIPVDYVVGTSMGGVVSGLYAAGYSPTEIEYLFNTKEFQDWARGRTEDTYTYNYASPEISPSFLHLNLSLDSTFQMHLNSSLANGASLNFAFAQLLAQPSAKAKYYFDKLMVPFRSMASDIYTQQQVVLSKGQLADAVRATMTVPLVFRPIRIERRKLYDGGLYNNFPVDVARSEFKPDVVIGVNVSPKTYNEYPYGKDDFDLPQTLYYAMLSNSDSTALGRKDIYLQPNTGNLTALDFGEVKTLFDAGYNAAIEKMDEIKRKIGRRVTPEQIAAKREDFRKDFTVLTFEDINVSGITEAQSAYVRKFFRKEGDVFTMQEIKQGYFRLAAVESFRSIYPSIVYNPESKNYEFNLDMEHDEALKLSIGGVLASRPIDNIYAGFDYSLLRKKLYTFSSSFNTGRFYQAAKARIRVDVPARFPYYLEPSFMYNNWSYLSTKGFLLDRDKLPFIEQSDRNYNLSLGFTNTYKGKLVLHAGYIQTIDRYSNRLEILSTDTLDKTNFNAFTTGITFKKGHLNRKQFASSGSMLTATVNYYNGRETLRPGSTSTIENKQSSEREWYKLKATYERYFGEQKHRIGYLLEAVASNQPFFQNYRSTLTSAAAFTPLPDSKTLFLDRYRSHQYLAGGVKYIYLFSQRLEGRFEGYAFQPYKPILQNQEQQAYYGDLLQGTSFIGSTSMVYHSIIGPAAISLNYYGKTAKEWGLLFHIGYIIFQNRALD